MNETAIHFAGLHHASLLISDLDASRTFYVSVLGMEVDDARPDMAFAGLWLQVGAQQIHLLQLDETSRGTGHAHPGRDAHTALSVVSIEPVRFALDSAGVDYSMSRSGRRALFCRDPDGNGLEFIEV
jgi:glyoxylase I family protein